MGYLDVQTSQSGLVTERDGLGVTPIPGTYSRHNASIKLSPDAFTGKNSAEKSPINKTFTAARTAPNSETPTRRTAEINMKA